LQRPLKTIAIKSGDVYIPRGVSVPALDKDQLWEFQPKKLGNVLISYIKLSAILYRKGTNLLICLGVGDAITGGDLYAVSYRNNCFSFFIYYLAEGF
jgi:V-type H+-transporting ATPase subunit A